MANPAAVRLTKLQYGLETTRGTAVAATRRLSALSATWRRQRNQDDGEDDISGSLARTTRAPVTTRAWSEFMCTLPLEFTQILMPLGSMRGGVAAAAPTQGASSGTANAAVTFTTTTMTDTRLAETPNRWVGATISSGGKTGVVTANTATVFTVASWSGGGAPANGGSWTITGIDYTRVFTLLDAGDPGPDTYTLQYEEANHQGDLDGMRAAYGFCQSMTVKGGDDGLSQVDVALMGRASEDVAATPAIAVPVLSRAPNLRWRVYVDTTWAGLGTTQVLGQAYGHEWKMEDFLHAGWYEDGRTDLSFTQHEIAQYRPELTLNMTNDPGAGGQAALEDAAKRDNTLRFVRLAIQGAGYHEQIWIDGAYYHAADSLAERGGDREGNSVLPVHLLGARDPVSGLHTRITVINTLPTWPV